MNPIASMLSAARSFFSRKKDDEDPMESIRQTIKNVSNTVANQPLIQPHTPVGMALKPLNVKSPTVGQALDFTRSVTVQPVARALGEGIMTVAGLERPLANKDLAKPGLGRFLFGDEELRNWNDKNRPSYQMMRDIGMDEQDIQKYAPLLVMAGVATDIVPGVGGVGKNVVKNVGKNVVKEGLETVGKNALKETAKQQAAKKTMAGLLHYTDDLVKRGMTVEEANKIGYKQYKEMIENGTLTTLRTTRDLMDEAQAQADPRKLTETIGSIIKSVVPNTKGYWLMDWVRTPNRFAHKVGLGKEWGQLRKQYDKYLLELPQEIDKVTEWKNRFSGPASDEGIFRWLDGEKVNLSDNDLQIAKEIKSYLKDWAVKLKLPEDKQITNYITHIFEKGGEFELDPAVARLVKSGKVAKAVYDPFLQKRMGKPDYIRSVTRALDAYVKRATRKYNIDPALQDIAQKAEGLDKASYDFLKGRIDRINLRPTTIENYIDTLLKQSPLGYKLGARPLTAGSATARQMVFRALLGLNPASALRNLQQTTNTYAVLGERDFLKGALKMMQELPTYIKNGDTELKRVGVLNSDVIQDRTISATKEFWKKTDETLFYMFDMAEKINRSIAYYGAKNKALRQGMSEQDAIEFGKSIVRKTQFNYDVVDTPASLQNDVMKTLFQFGSYPMKQMEFLGEMALRERDVAGMIRWTVANFVFLGTLGKVLGMEPEDLLPSFRFGVPPTMQLPAGVIQMPFVTEDEWGQPLSTKERILNDNLTSGALNYVPAGAQLKKMITGTDTVLQGGNYTDSGRLRYPAGNPAQSILFGPYTTKEAKEYYDGGSSPLGTKQTDLYNSLVESGVMDKNEAYDTVTQHRQDSIEEEYGEPKSLTDHIGEFFGGIFGKKSKKVQEESDDPLVRAFNSEIEADEKASKIREVFKLGLSREDTEKVLKQEGLGTYEDAQVIIMKALGIENGTRPNYITEITKDMSDEDKWKTYEWLAEQKVLTASVVDYWLEQGDITDEQADALKILVKMATGKYKAPKGKAPPKVSVKGVSVSLPKLSGLDKAVKTTGNYEFKPTERPTMTKGKMPTVPAVQVLRRQAELKYDKPLSRL